MKHLSLLFAFVISFLSCNESGKTVVQAGPVASNMDTLNIINVSKKNITRDLVLGKFNYMKDSMFTKVNSSHSSKLIYLNKDVYDAFKNMHNAAKKDGVKLIIISGTRNFEEQKVIWERKWKMYNDLKPLERTKKILEYSSMPSTSRHHWGTDLDLNNLNNSYFKSGKGEKEYKWLTEHANDYGFYQVYTSKENGRTGYNEEKWHWSYLPLASKYLDYYNKNINYSDINGFKGFEFAETTKMVSEYVNGIAETAKKFNQD